MQADTIISFKNQAHKVGLAGENRKQGDHFEHLQFDLSDIKPEYKLIGAELRLYKNASSFKTNKVVQVFATRSSMSGE